MAAFKESLNKFKKQQEKCQSTLTSIAAKAGPKTNVAPRVVPASTLAKLPAPAVKFSDNTERLQYINNIRKSPVGAQMKRVIDMLLETRHAFTPEQINEACYVDVNANKAVFESLKNNPKVDYKENRFSYKSKHEATDKNDLLKLINKNTNGIAVADLKDAYPTVMEDLQALKVARKIWLLSTMDSNEYIAYPNNFAVPIKVDDELKRMFLETELPQDMIDIEKDLQKNGMKPATNTAKRRAAAQIQGVTPQTKQKKKREHRITKRTKLTNHYLPEFIKEHFDVPKP